MGAAASMASGTAHVPWVTHRTMAAAARTATASAPTTTGPDATPWPPTARRLGGALRSVTAGAFVATDRSRATTPPGYLPSTSAPLAIAHTSRRGSAGTLGERHSRREFPSFQPVSSAGMGTRAIPRSRMDPNVT